MNMLSALVSLKVIGFIILAGFLLQGIDLAQNIAVADLGSAFDNAADPTR